MSRKKAKKKDRNRISYDIDLHGLTLAEALAELRREMHRILQSGQGEVSVKVITGKGLHSGPDGGILSREVHGHFKAIYAQYIISIEESPHAVAISGLPIRGHFTAKLQISLRR